MRLRHRQPRGGTTVGHRPRRVATIAAVAGMSFVPAQQTTAEDPAETLHGVWLERLSSCPPTRLQASGNWTIVLRSGQSPVVHVNLFRDGQQIAAWGINTWTVVSSEPLVLTYGPLTLRLTGNIVELTIDIGCPHTYVGQAT